jgi:hypothetical protein
LLWRFVCSARAGLAVLASYFLEEIPMTEKTKPPTLTDAEIKKELVNDSLGTIDPADTTDTDPKNDSARDKGTGARENA